MNKKREVTKKGPGPAAAAILLNDLRRMIEEARRGVATTVNAALTTLYWRVGKRIRKEILLGGRADYGKEILATLSQQLCREYGNGFSYSALTRMVKFYEAFGDPRILRRCRKD